jgi:hypothetical protein
MVDCAIIINKTRRVWFRLFKSDLTITKMILPTIVKWMKVLKKCWLKKLKSFNFVLIEKKSFWKSCYWIGLIKTNINEIFPEKENDFEIQFTSPRSDWEIGTRLNEWVWRSCVDVSIICFVGVNFNFETLKLWLRLYTQRDMFNFSKTILLKLFYFLLIFFLILPK